ncbi:MAG: ribonuclease P protein component [Candidatus Magasanikbacteria bacterium]|nr:ribonuclease P protein component [Candidatus Magasanikbacteria bacterium]
MLKDERNSRFHQKNNFSHMLARVSRIAADKEIKRVLKLGKRFSVPECSLFLLANTLGRPRVTVIVASGVSKRAVVRNRLKRQARDVLRLAVEHGAITQPLDIIVMIRAGAAKIEDEVRRDFFKKLFERARLFVPGSVV